MNVIGDRYELDLKCIYCNCENRRIWYAPTSDIYTFSCERCKKVNFITSNLKTKKVEDIVIGDVKEAFLMATNTIWSERDINEICKESLEKIKGEKNVSKL